MSLFDWLPGRSRRAAESSGLGRTDGTRPLKPGLVVREPAPRAAAGPASPRRLERMEQRERLYSVVRESMVRSGVLSSGYKFKVLSLDPRGHQFLVMMDLAREFGQEGTRLSEIEVLIAQTARQRFDIVVKAVYWRLHDHVAIGRPQARPAATVTAAPTSGTPTPVASTPSAQATPAPAAAPLGGRVPLPGHGTEPLGQDEVEAFKKALSDAVNTARARNTARIEAATAAAVKAEEARERGESTAPPDSRMPRGGFGWLPRPGKVLTGYEDTEVLAPRDLPVAPVLESDSEPDAEPGAGLSETQYGELR
jgi:hypothetical protein